LNPLITVRGNIAREGVQITHHCSEPIDDATDEWLPQFLNTFSCNIPQSSHSVINWIQIWQIWVQQLR